MNKDELERRISMRMENCEDALTHHPDSVACLARYHELGEIRYLVQQLGSRPQLSPDPDHELNIYLVEENVRNLLTDMGKEGLTPDDAKTLRLLREQYGTIAKPTQMQDIFQHLEAVRIAFPVNDKYRQVTYGPFDRFVLAKYVEEWDPAYNVEISRKPQEAPGQPKSPDPAQDKGDQANGQDAPAQPAQVPEIGRLPLRRMVLELVQAGSKSYGDLVKATGQLDENLQFVVRWLLNHQKIEEYEQGWYRIPDMHAVVRARKQSEKAQEEAGKPKRRGMGRKKRPEYKGEGDGINLRKAILQVLKESLPGGLTATEICRNVAEMKGSFDCAISIPNVEIQLQNLKKRNVVGEAKCVDRQSVWQARP